jgi:hypothetical protein
MNNIEIKKALEAALEAVKEADNLNESSTSPYSILRNKLITIDQLLNESIVFTTMPVFTLEELL